MSPWAASLISVVAVSLVSLVGLATLSASERRVRRIATVLVSFAVGALLGDAFIHLIPETFAEGAATLQPSLLILAGMMLFFNHLFRKKLNEEPNPLEVEMYLYQENVNSYVMAEEMHKMQGGAARGGGERE